MTELKNERSHSLLRSQSHTHTQKEAVRESSTSQRSGFPWPLFSSRLVRG